MKRDVVKTANRGRLPTECMFQRTNVRPPRKRHRTCKSCLWNWEDVHKLDGTRVCYRSNSPKFHMQISDNGSCTEHENRR